jgi:hypothetical protein
MLHQFSESNKTSAGMQSTTQVYISSTARIYPQEDEKIIKHHTQGKINVQTKYIECKNS